MMKNSSILKWTNNKNNNKINNNKNNNKNANKNWLHPPEALQKGHIAYLVKFLGHTEVDQPKGIEVVKEGIRKLKFNQMVRKSEGTKTPKVELTISIDGVAIQEPKSKKILHQHPLHRISYCADDKAEKRFFSYIAKEADTETHTCYVFVSDKLAEEITFTIGQAFDLAYRRFLDTAGKEGDLRKQLMSLQKQLHVIQKENESLKTRLAEVAALKNSSDVDVYMKKNNITNLFNINGNESSTDPNPVSSEPPSPDTNHVDLPPVPPRNVDQFANDEFFNSPLTSGDSDDDFNPRAHEISGDTSPVDSNAMHHSEDDDDFDPRAEEKKPYSPVNLQPSNNIINSPPPLLPPPRPARPHEIQNGLIDNIFNAPPADPFGEDTFPTGNNSNSDILAQFNEMKAGFSRGLSFGTADDDFTLESLDPLKN